MLTNSNNLNDLQDNDLRYLFRNDDADLRIIRDAGDRGANFGVKCLAEAAGNGRLDIVKYLVEEKHVLDFTKRYDVCSGRDEDENGTKPLVKAAQSGYVQIVQYLLDFNPKLAIIRDDDYALPIHGAVAYYSRPWRRSGIGSDTIQIDYAKCLERLAYDPLNNRKWGLVNAESTRRGTPLCVAANRGNSTAVKILLKRGAKLDGGSYCREGNALLQTYDDPTGTKELLNQAKANLKTWKKGFPELSEMDDDGALWFQKCAIDHSCVDQYLEILRDLSPERLCHSTRSGKTTLHALVKAIGSASSRRRDRLYESDKQKLREFIPVLIQKGVDINAVNTSSDLWREVSGTALHLAAYYSDIKTIEVLLENGAKIDAINENGENVLFAAARSVNSTQDIIATMEFLIAKDSNLLGKDQDADVKLLQTLCKDDKFMVYKEVMAKIESLPSFDHWSQSNQTKLLTDALLRVQFLTFLIKDKAFQYKPEENSLDRPLAMKIIFSSRVRRIEDLNNVKEIFNLFIEKEVFTKKSLNEIRDKDGNPLLKYIFCCMSPEVALELLRFLDNDKKMELSLDGTGMKNENILFWIYYGASRYGGEESESTAKLLDYVRKKLKGQFEELANTRNENGLTPAEEYAARHGGLRSEELGEFDSPSEFEVFRQSHPDCTQAQLKEIFEYALDEGNGKLAIYLMDHGFDVWNSYSTPTDLWAKAFQAGDGNLTKLVSAGAGDGYLDFFVELFDRRNWPLELLKGPEAPSMDPIQAQINDEDSIIRSPIQMLTSDDYNDDKLPLLKFFVEKLNLTGSKLNGLFVHSDNYKTWDWFTQKGRYFDYIGKCSYHMLAKGDFAECKHWVDELVKRDSDSTQLLTLPKPVDDNRTVEVTILQAASENPNPSILRYLLDQESREKAITELRRYAEAEKGNDHGKTALYFLKQKFPPKPAK